MFFIQYVLSTVINKEETVRKRRHVRRQSIKQQQILLKEVNVSCKRKNSTRSTVTSQRKKSKKSKRSETISEEEGSDGDTHSIDLSDYMDKEREIIMECAEKIDRLTNIVSKCNKRINTFASTLNALKRNKGNTMFRNDIEFDFRFIKNNLEKIGMRKSDDCDLDGDSESDEDDNEEGSETEDDNFHASILKHYPEAHDHKFMQNVHLVLHELRNGNKSSKSSVKWNETHESGFVSYVICRILSAEGTNYNPHRRKEHMIFDYVSENKKLFRDVTNFAVHKLGITVDRFKQNFLMCPSHNFRRKTIENILRIGFTWKFTRLWIFQDGHPQLIVTGNILLHLSFIGLHPLWLRKKKKRKEIKRVKKQQFREQQFSH